MDALIADKVLGANLGAPSISHGSENLYMRGPLEEATRENLSKVHDMALHACCCLLFCAQANGCWPHYAWQGCVEG